MDILIKYKIEKLTIKYTFKIDNNNNNYKIFILHSFSSYIYLL